LPLKVDIPLHTRLTAAFVPGAGIHCRGRRASHSIISSAWANSAGGTLRPMRTSPYLCYYVRPSMSEIIVPTDKPCDLCGARGWIRPINGPTKPCPRRNAVGENIVAPDDDVEPTRVRLGPKRRVRRPRFA